MTWLRVAVVQFAPKVSWSQGGGGRWSLTWTRARRGTRQRRESARIMPRVSVSVFVSGGGGALMGQLVGWQVDTGIGRCGVFPRDDL